MGITIAPTILGFFQPQVNLRDVAIQKALMAATVDVESQKLLKAIEKGKDVDVIKLWALLQGTPRDLKAIVTEANNKLKDTKYKIKEAKLPDYASQAMDVAATEYLGAVRDAMKHEKIALTALFYTAPPVEGTPQDSDIVKMKMIFKNSARVVQQGCLRKVIPSDITFFFKACMNRLRGRGGK